MSSPLLCLSRVSLSVPGKGTPVLDKVSLDVFQGEFIILLGSNGSGKSSVLKLINGLFLPTSGTLSFSGADLLKIPVHKRTQSIVTLTQDPNLSTFSDLTVLENCLLSFTRGKRSCFSIPSQKEKEEIKNYLRSYNPSLCDKTDTLVSHLSGGQRQALALAMNLKITPSLLLLDEHTSALDPATAKKIMQLTYETAKDRKITTIVATHNLNDALQYGDRLIAMKDGKIINDIKEKEKKTLSYESLLRLYSNR